ncbi:MAG TPA: sulfotransferase domain-containing protein [Reyranella sp.]|nr:sulfotransferase domain-containing protein [Reyranella sp.]
MKSLPILSTIPRSGTWFLRYAVSFLAHLDRGGRIDNRLTGRTVGDPTGPAFDFRRFKGGPLFNVRGTMPVDHLFIGHTVCPGFAAMAGEVDWWRQTPFHVPGYDYFHEGLNYRYTPVELAPYLYTRIRVPALERSAKKRGQRTVLVYRDPLDQAASYFWYCQHHDEPTYNSFNGCPLSSVPFDDYLFERALPSYAKQLISYQVMAERQPDLVQLVPYERLMERPVEVMAAILDHLSGTPENRPALGDAVRLAHSEHLKVIERELGQSLDGTRKGRLSHMRQSHMRNLEQRLTGSTRRQAMALLGSLGVNADLFEWTVPAEAATAA